MARSSTVDRDYILGTRDQETLRLGIQHNAWAPIVHECWRQAGIAEGDRVIDVGAGPGFAAFDLAELVGPEGHVTAAERSARFVAAGRAMARGRGIRNVDFIEVDLMIDPLPPETYDAAWCRWVASFVESPVVLVEKIAHAVRPGGVAIFHEYVDYASWRFSPPLPLVEDYIERIMRSWREAGGEPDVAARIPSQLVSRAFELESVKPRVYCVRPGDALWIWIGTFVDSNLGRMVELGQGGPAWASAVRNEFRSAEADPTTLMLTPMVLEIIARRTGEDSPHPPRSASNRTSHP